MFPRSLAPSIRPIIRLFDRFFWLSVVAVALCGAQVADAGLIRRGAATVNPSPPPLPGTPFYKLIDQSSRRYTAGDYLFDSSDVLLSETLFSLDYLELGTPASLPGEAACAAAEFVCHWEFTANQLPQFSGHALNALRIPGDPVFHWELRNRGSGNLAAPLYRWEQSSDPMGLVKAFPATSGNYVRHWEVMFTPGVPLALEPGEYELWLFTTLLPPVDAVLATISEPLECFESDSPPSGCEQNPFAVVHQTFPGTLTFGTALPLSVVVPQPGTVWLLFPLALLLVGTCQPPRH